MVVVVSRERIIDVLMNGDPKKLAKLLDKLKAGRELDELFHAVLDICRSGEQDQPSSAAEFCLTEPVLQALEEHLRTFSALSAHEKARELLDILAKQAKGQQQSRAAKRTIVLLLRALIEQVPLLNANRLRELIKGPLLQRCVEYWREDEHDLAAQLTLCILQTLLMELAYFRAVSTGKSQRELSVQALRLWEHDLVEQIEHAQQCTPLLLLCHLLLLNATACLEKEEQNENGEKTNDAQTPDDDEQCGRRSSKKRRHIFKQLRREMGDGDGDQLLKGKKETDEQEMPEGGGGEDVENPAPVEWSYNSALFTLLSRHIGAICQCIPAKLHFPILNFMVTFAQRNRLNELLTVLAKCPAIRFGDVGDLVGQALLQALPPEFATAKGIKWSKWAQEGVVVGIAKRRKRKRQRTTTTDEKPPSDWSGLLAIFEGANTAEDMYEQQEQQLANALAHLSNAELEQLLTNAPLLQSSSQNSTTAASSSSTSSATTISPTTARASLRLLCAICAQRHTFTMPFRAADFVQLMMAEPEPRIQSLKFGAKVVQICAAQKSPQMPDFCTFCLALFRPLDQLPAAADIGEEAKRRFLLAEIGFLRALLTHVPFLLSDLAPLIVQLLPEFFVQASNYRMQSLTSSATPTAVNNNNFLQLAATDTFPDRLEHALACLCREINKRAKHFGRLLPFALANSLTGQREMRFHQYLMLSALDEHGLALLATNLPAMEKRKFALLQQQFYEANKIIG